MLSPGLGGGAGKALPVYIQPVADNNAEKAPQYPSLKMNVSQIQQEVADILEESFEERRRESIVEKSRPSKIKKILNSPPKTSLMPEQ